MCGIAGFLGTSDPTLLDRMLSRLIHRGPDDAGQHCEPGVALGTRRLRVIDPEGGHQPIANETKSVWVVLNGEIYNYRELRDDLIRKGHRFLTQCDTEVLVHLYEQEGEEGVRRLRGMFAYALWDRERRVLVLARDPLGIKPLYYATPGKAPDSELRIVFSSELPSLLEALGSPRVAPRAVSQYLRCLYVPSPGTLFEGIRHVMPGELLRITPDRIESRRYWTPARPVDPLTDSDRADASDRFRNLLRETVRAHLVSDVPLGLFLSGGLDSGAILAMMRQVTPGPIRTFSIGYDAPADHSYNELDAARTLARAFDTDHQEERLSPDATRLLPKIVDAMGEPFADSSAIPTYLVSEFARRSVTVALTGIGGDEMFGGYPRYLGLRVAARYAAVPRPVRTWIARRLAPLLREGEGSRNRSGRIKRFLRDGHLSLTDQYLQWVTFLPPEWGSMAFTDDLRRHVASDADSDQWQRGLFESWPSDDPSDRAMGLDVQTYLPDDLLRMGDRLSMAHSLELRVPFCDPQVMAFARSISPQVRFSGWRLKGFMRDALEPLLPQSILRRAKYGFQVPLARWLKQELREMVRDVLSDEAVRARGYVKPEYVRWLIDNHERGSRNCTDQIYALLVLELWCRQHKIEADWADA